MVCGIRMISLTGGEPLVNPHFYDNLDEIRKRNIVLSTIYTNGKLVDDKLLDELESRGMHLAFHISFDGVGWHDWLRGEEGAEGIANVHDGRMNIVFENEPFAENVQEGMKVTVGENSSTIDNVGNDREENVFAQADTTLKDGTYEAVVVYKKTQVLSLLFDR